jgi:hypothetical protein
MTVNLRPYWIYFLILFSGCAIFAWDIHAPGVLSNNFTYNIQPAPQRIALYLDPNLAKYVSTDRGGRMADPQTYHVGEAMAPMLVEAFQNAFEEFVMLEIEPTPEVLKHYGIPYVVAIRIKDFGNRVTLKGQALTLVTEAAVYDSNLKKVGHFESTGTSDAEKIFSKKGGPEVNLNAAIENNIVAIIQYLQDSVRTGNW